MKATKNFVTIALAVFCGVFVLPMAACELILRNAFSKNDAQRSALNAASTPSIALARETPTTKQSETWVATTAVVPPGSDTDAPISKNIAAVENQQVPAPATIQDEINKETASRLTAFAQEFITNHARDPDSVTFGQIFVAQGPKHGRPGDQIAVCGEYNAKNGLGGYAGMEKFVYSFIDGSVSFSTQSVNSDAMLRRWNTRCAKWPTLVTRLGNW